MNWTLVAVVVILAVFAIVGYVRGLIKSVFSVLAMLIALTLTTLLAPQIGHFLEKNTALCTQINEKTENFLDKQGVLKSEDNDIDIQDTHIPSYYKNLIEEQGEKYLNEGIEAYNNYVVETVGGMIFSAVVYLITFAFVYILIHVIGFMLNLVSRLPVLKQLNRLGGGILGLCYGLLVVWVVFVAIAIAANTEFAVTVYKDINSNLFLRMIYDNNVILQLIFKLF